MGITKNYPERKCETNLNFLKSLSKFVIFEKNIFKIQKIKLRIPKSWKNL